MDQRTFFDIMGTAPATVTVVTTLGPAGEPRGLTVGAVTSVQATASFDGYDGMCVAFQVANGTEVGATDLGMMPPADYPEFLFDTCTPGAPEGAWWDMTSITLSINWCAVSSQEQSWGAMKAKFVD
jgi:hypothetical protein